MHAHWCSDCEEWWDCDESEMDCWEGENASCGCDEYGDDDDDY